jgi:hypothetical protein
MITRATESRPCSLRSTSPPDVSSANATRAIVQASSAVSLDRVEAAVPSDLDVHIVMDNYATHKTQLIRDWFAKRPRWHVHLTPTAASWINQVERFFALLAERQIKRGNHRSVRAWKPP